MWSLVAWTSKSRSMGWTVSAWSISLCFCSFSKYRYEGDGWHFCTLFASLGCVFFILPLPTCVYVCVFPVTVIYLFLICYFLIYCRLPALPLLFEVGFKGTLGLLNGFPIACFAPGWWVGLFIFNCFKNVSLGLLDEYQTEPQRENTCTQIKQNERNWKSQSLSCLTTEQIPEIGTQRRQSHETNTIGKFFPFLVGITTAIPSVCTSFLWKWLFVSILIQTQMQCS